MVMLPSLVIAPTLFIANRADGERWRLVRRCGRQCSCLSAGVLAYAAVELARPAIEPGCSSPAFRTPALRQTRSASMAMFATAWATLSHGPPLLMRAWRAGLPSGAKQYSRTVVNTGAGDRAGKQYWDAVWTDAPQADLMDPTTPGFRNHVDRGFAGLFSTILRDHSSFELLEVGCAQSRWLPYFAREHGARVCGLDYSEIGCQAERAMLRDAGIDGEIVWGDLFEPPAALLNRFDVVVSFGLVEHFDDTAGVIRALSEYLKPGGILVTVIPNMVGAIGAIERWINRGVYDMHVRLAPSDLAAAHGNAGLAVTSSRYFLSTNFGVLNTNGLDAGAWATRAKLALCVNLGRVSKAIWAIEEHLRPLKATRMFAPYVVVTARR